MNYFFVHKVLIIKHVNNKLTALSESGVDNYMKYSVTAAIGNLGQRINN